MDEEHGEDNSASDVEVCNWQIVQFSQILHYCLVTSWQLTQDRSEDCLLSCISRSCAKRKSLNWWSICVINVESYSTLKCWLVVCVASMFNVFPFASFIICWVKKQQGNSRMLYICFLVCMYISCRKGWIRVCIEDSGQQFRRQHARRDKVRFRCSCKL